MIRELGKIESRHHISGRSVVYDTFDLALVRLPESQQSSDILFCPSISEYEQTFAN
jgi:hypothetical protein